MDTFKRTASIERADGASGAIRGVLATDGEASDGHILSIEGLEAEAPAPLLFGHDSYTLDGPLGSWTLFKKSAHELRGVAQIELEGSEPQASKRRDLAHMVAQGHVRGLSVRWEPIDPPVRRTSLSKGHPAFVDAATETDDRKRYGYYFPTSRLLEGSVVVLGADREALIGRLAQTSGEVRAFWRGVLEDVLVRREFLEPRLRKDLDELVDLSGRLRAHGIDDMGTVLRICQAPTDISRCRAIELGNGKRVLLPEEAYVALLGEANERLRLAFDLMACSEVGAAYEVDEEDDPLALDVPARHPAKRASRADAGESPAPKTMTLEQAAREIEESMERVTQGLLRRVRDEARAAVGR